MRILDLRPGTVRLLDRVWSGGPPARGRRTGPEKRPHLGARMAARVTRMLAARRVAGRRLDEQGPFVVSVGNLALGGTGKTPVTAALARDLALAGHRGAILTRGFGSRLAGPLLVNRSNDLAGDEARLMAGALAEHGWPVIQARRREAGMTRLLGDYPGTEIVIVEDGHQTSGVGRHLDILILDRWDVVQMGEESRVVARTGAVVPFGPWRESAAGARRAGIWLLETGEDLPAVGREGQAVATFRRELKLVPGGQEPGTSGEARRAAVLSGIARPEAFEESLAGTLGTQPVLAIRCGDHVRYAPRLVATIAAAVRSAGADELVTTSKDWVKLQAFWPEDIPVRVAELVIRWGQATALPALVGERLAEFNGPKARRAGPV